MTCTHKELTGKQADAQIEVMLPQSILSIAERRRQALAVVGRFRSGRSDISERHDDHLAEVFDHHRADTS